MGISWWESVCVFELEWLNEVTHTRTLTHKLRASSLPRINQVIRKEGAHQLPFSSERRTERQMDGEKRSLGRKWMIIIIIVEWRKNKGFPVCVCVRAQVLECVWVEGGCKAQLLLFLDLLLLINSSSILEKRHSSNNLTERLISLSSRASDTPPPRTLNYAH